VIHYGLTAGLRFSEMGKMAPGLVCDLFILRMRYDDQQHGIKRESGLARDTHGLF